MNEATDYPPLSDEAREALRHFTHLLLDHAPGHEIRRARLDFMAIREQDKQRAAQRPEQGEGSAGDATRATT